MNPKTSNTPSALRAGTSYLRSLRDTAGVILLAVIGASQACGQQGLSSLYYNNSTLTEPAVPGSDTAVDFSTLTPPAGVGANNFSARWTGQIIAGPQVLNGPLPTAVPADSLPLTYPYTFRVDSNNGVRLWVNGKLVIDSWIRPQGPSQEQGTIRLTPNLRYDIKLEYRDTPAADTPSVRLQWSYPGQALQPIPQAQLSTQRQGLLAEYYSMASIYHPEVMQGSTRLQSPMRSEVLSAFAFARTDPQIDYVFGATGSPDPSLDRDNFGMRWRGNLNVPAGGTYRIYVTIDGIYERVTLVINGETLFRTTTSTTTPPSPYIYDITLPAGNVPILMEYGESYQGNARIKLEWSSADITREVIGQARFTPPAGSDVNMLLEQKRFPFNIGVINVKTYYGAKGDGSTDDTAALQRAISENIGSTSGFAKWLYLPAGEYLVSDTLKWSNPDLVSTYHQWNGGLSLIGDGQGQTIIKLKNTTFTDPNIAPKAVIMTGSGFYTTSKGMKREIGEGNEGARNNLADLTIDTGSGNTRAIGVDYISSNRGSINNVTIRSSDPNRVGIAGLSMKRRYPGPALGTNLTIEGFDYGIDMSWFEPNRGAPEYGMTFDGLTLRNQMVAGIFYQENTLQIRNLTSVGDKPVVLNPASSGQGFIAVVDGIFTYTGTAAPPSAITLTKSRIFLRNVSETGYASVLHGDTRHFIPEGTHLNNGLASPIGQLFPEDNETMSLNLRVPATPAFDDPDLNNWVDVTSFGANFTDRADDTQKIQDAIDSFLPGGPNASKTTLYFPSNGVGAWANHYLLNPPGVIVRGNLKRIVGFNAGISNLPNRYGASAPPYPPVQSYLSFQQTAFDVTVEGIDFGCSYPNAGAACAIEHRSPKALVIKDSTVSGRLVRMAYRNAAPPLGGNLGPCFIENVIGRYFDITERQNVYARQLNLEHEAPNNVTAYTPWVVNSGGGELCALGVKTEGAGILIDTNNGSATEVIGGLLYPANTPTGVPEDMPAFQCTDAQFSLTMAESCYLLSPYKRYTIWVRETRDGITRDWRRAPTTQALPPNLYQRGQSFGAVAPLYVGCPVRELAQALLVVGNPTTMAPFDAAAKARLENPLGFQVTVVDDALSTSSNAIGKDVVFVSPTIDVNSVGTKFRDVAVPVVFSRGWGYGNMNMSPAGVYGNAYGGPYTQLNLVGSHPLNAGLSGTQTVLTSASTMGFGRPSATGVSIASIPGYPTHWGIFGYEAGATMFNSQPAPERRVGFFLGSTQNNLTPVGWNLFDAAVNWVTE